MKLIRGSALVLMMWASLAWASGSERRLNMPVGQTTTVSLSSRVAKVVVTDPELVDARTEGRKVILVARATGTTQVTVKTVDGDQRFTVYVAKDKYGLPY